MDNIPFLSFLALPFLFKILLLVLIGGFIIFGIVVFNQVRVMNRIVHFGMFSTVLFVISALIIVLSAVLFFYGLAIL